MLMPFVSMVRCVTSVIADILHIPFQKTSHPTFAGEVIDHVVAGRNVPGASLIPPAFDRAASRRRRPAAAGG
jgi:hypothetical protein